MSTPAVQGPFVEVVPTDTNNPDTYHEAIQAGVDAVGNVLKRIESFFDISNYQSSVPQVMDLNDKRQLFQWEYNEFPPHLKVVPFKDQMLPFEIFNVEALIQTTLIIGNLLPKKIEELAPKPGMTMADIERRNEELQSTAQNMYRNPNIGLRDDWYTDEVFAQQQFTGTNPTTLTKASSVWLGRFSKAAAEQQNQAAVDLISSSADDLYLQDYSYFREAVGAAPDASFYYNGSFGCASVSLFHLPSTGKLHPVAIILDYKGSIEESVTVFNRQLVQTQPSVDEKSDWPWRYAKMCAQVSDWLRHEVTIHLTNTHLVEEAIIVGAHRTLPARHIVFNLLEPHWQTTLAVNALARSTLVPKVITEIIGLTPDQLYKFTTHAYTTFDFTGLYVPNDLNKRGFPVDQLNSKKFHNYGYGRNIKLMWDSLRKFISTILYTYYPGGDAQVAGDKYILDFCNEMRSSSGARLPNFPQVKTLEGLIDMVTMCIHIASPQHTAVNYTQQYYQVFVPNKPASLYTPIPTAVADLKRYTEKEVLNALPLTQQRDWLLMAQLPYLLSFRVAADQNILAYAQNEQKNRNPAIAQAATVLTADLEKLVGVFKKNSDELDDQTTPYTVMDPSLTASSILI